MFTERTTIHHKSQATLTTFRREENDPFLQRLGEVQGGGGGGQQNETLVRGSRVKARQKDRGCNLIKAKGEIRN